MPSNNDMRAHTVQVVTLLAQHYGFDVDEALSKIELPARRTVARPPSLIESRDIVHVLGTSSEDETHINRRANKPRLTSKKTRKKKAAPRRYL